MLLPISLLETLPNEKLLVFLRTCMLHVQHIERKYVQNLYERKVSIFLDISLSTIIVTNVRNRYQ